jgi:competence protein ComEC
LSGVFAVWFLIFAIGANGSSNADQNANKTATSVTTNIKDADTQKSSVDRTQNSDAQSTNDAKPVSTDNSNNLIAVNGQLKVHYINVGQADSILLQQGSSSMLIDAGNNGDDKTVKNYISQQGITKLDYIVGTHPHEDHIGGMDYIINSFQIGKIYMPKATSTTKTYQDVINAISNKGMQINVPKPGDTFKLGDATCTILAPNSSSYEDLNNYSIVIKVTFGSNSFMFDGDAEDISENEMLAKGYDISADVLKVGHHGSSSSTTQAFLNKVNPKYAVISVGKGNDYGHPHKTTMEKLQEKGIKVYRTDENGTIVATSDGKVITFNTNPGSYAYAGTGSSASSGGSSGGSTSSGSATTAPPPTTTTNNSRIVYYTPSGKSYHYDKNCRTLAKSKTILSQSLGEALNSSHNDPCDVCVK